MQTHLLYYGLATNGGNQALSKQAPNAAKAGLDRYQATHRQRPRVEGPHARARSSAEVLDA